MTSRPLPEHRDRDPSAVDSASPTGDRQADSGREQLAERMERRLAVPVMLAALVSIPAVFLTTLDGPAATAGRVLNWVSLAVLVGEAILLFLLTRNRLEWLRTHKWMVCVVALTIPAVVLAIGPAQLLRAVRLVGSVRVLRAGRIIKAGRVLRRHLGPSRRWSRALLMIASLVAAGFVAVVLADPTSRGRELLRLAGQEWEIAAASVAGTLLFAATVLVLRRGRGADRADRATDRES